MAVNARVAALRMLKVRPRSEYEVRSKLKERQFDASTINAAIEYLYSLDLLNDRAFTKSWIAYRLARPFGFKRIVLELRDKGIDPAIIDEEIQPFKESFDQAIVLDLARRRAKRLIGIDPMKRKKRIIDFLLRRGFTYELILKVIKEL